MENMEADGRKEMMKSHTFELKVGCTESRGKKAKGKKRRTPSCIINSCVYIYDFQRFDFHIFW